jgi:hypothetical protein
MSKRKVTLKLTTQKDLVVRESEARTFGELKSEFSDIKFDGMRVVERSTKNTLQMDDAILPATDFVLFVVPEKVKSGYHMPVIDVETASYNELRSYISTLNKIKNANIPINGKIENLRNGLRQYLKGTETPDDLKPVVEEATSIEIIQECKNQINRAIDTLIEVVEKASATSVPAEEYVIKTTLKDLENEVDEIKKSLKL